MVNRMKPMNLFRFLVVLTAGVLMISCGPKAQQPLSQLDTPEQHTFTGIRLLDQEKFADAGREFELALRLDPRYARAHAGIGLVKACQGDFTGGLESLKQAEKHTRSDQEKIFVLVGFIRVYTLSHSVCLRIGTVCKPDEAWLAYSKDAFDRAVLIDPKAASAYYFMGEAYLAALDLDQSGRMFSRVLDLNGEYIKEADGRWKLVQKIQRAMPGTATGKKIALVERITRADAAALFLEELKIDVLYARRTPKTFDTAFKDPEKAKSTAAGRTSAADIGSHPLRADIEGMIRIGMRGLEVYPDGNFRPDELVDRATYAMMIEDILIKISGDNALATRFIGGSSPFPDLRADLPYFNAVMVVTSRGLMEARDMVSGAFSPLEPVGGADALLVIRKMREELRY
ncbi:MAG: S-layer homology domain-containing protein [Deltaproteobacteria bacterium]|nr:S-layer homology domain-containing protein [Deltaproteobacteria bacterium]